MIGGTNAWCDAPCIHPKPFICYNANFSGAARFIGITTPLSWPQAQAYCREHHTELASALNSSDQNMLVQVRNIQGDSWIGLYRDSWKWSDGTIASNLPWASGLPDNYYGSENCAVVYYGLLYDMSCTNVYSFFCHSISTMRNQTVRLQVKSDGSVFDPAFQSFILEQMKQKLKEHGMLENTTVTWRVQPDGNIFKKKKDDL
ncbi:C-type lectin 1-like [Tachysurus fulvidraco]|uniref:C-type lectin 1-like n=1 Tax=Tachysurus fulvidraco TaxID=1234273 RepID=UPI001FEDBAA9|nr:C-type lectin 1-like [Tachysurus fulvidraco]